jgi:isopentenyldiphosphate isomerase
MEDIAILVNDNDEIIGHKLRSELVDADRWRICSVLLINDKHEVLIAQRAATKRHSPLKWGPSCAGTLSKGESYEECAARELAEELGVRGVELKVLSYDKYDDDIGSKRYCKTFAATCNWDLDKFVAQKEEVESLEWIDEQKLKNRLREEPERFVDGVDMLLKALEKL